MIGNWPKIKQRSKSFLVKIWIKWTSLSNRGIVLWSRDNLWNEYNLLFLKSFYLHIKVSLKVFMMTRIRRLQCWAKIQKVAKEKKTNRKIKTKVLNIDTYYDELFESYFIAGNNLWSYVINYNLICYVFLFSYSQPVILLRSIKLVPRTTCDLLFQSKLTPRKGTAALRQLNTYW